MSDILDMFGEKSAPVRYRASLWLFNSTKGVISLGGVYSTLEAAQQALQTFTALDLSFTPERVAQDALSRETYKVLGNIAVVTEESEEGSVVSHAPVEERWYPIGDRRRLSKTL